MNNTKRASVKSIILLIIVIIIPLLATTFVGIYGYNRYKPNHFSTFMNDIEDDTEKKLEGYLQYVTFEYEPEPYYITDVLKGDERVLTFAIYRGIIEYPDLDENENIIRSQDLIYYFAAYNINYEKLIEVKDPTGETKLLYNAIPSIYISVIDQADPDNKTLLTMGVPQDSLLIDDYNATPERDYRNNVLNSRYLKWEEWTATTTFSKDITVKVFMTDDPTSTSPLDEAIIANISLENIERSPEEIHALETPVMVDGFLGDANKAGYFMFILKTKLWWQGLIAFVLVGMVSFSFYIVWQAEEEQLKPRPNPQSSNVKTKKERKK